ncbi:hypothetical protein PENTCL1PPCAC_30315, partial [Pristionchus entomophagus]
STCRRPSSSSFSSSLLSSPSTMTTRSESRSTSMTPPSRSKLIEEGFIRKPETGHPRVTCVIRNHKEPRGMAKLEECYAIPQVSEVSVGCFALWNETEGYLHQGCSNQHDVAFRGDNCQKGACIKSRMVAKEFKYCCCYGDECNANPIDLGSL